MNMYNSSSRETFGIACQEMNRLQSRVNQTNYHKLFEMFGMLECSKGKIKWRISSNGIHFGISDEMFNLRVYFSSSSLVGFRKKIEKCSRNQEINAIKKQEIKL